MKNPRLEWVMDDFKIYDQDDLIQNQKNLKRIFFYRIAGTGMGACAALFKQAGFDVEGGDSAFYPPMSDYLKESQIPCSLLSDLTDEKLKSFDLIIVGNVVARNSEDAQRLERLGVPLTSFPQALGSLILKNREVIGVSGTHGKTTTTFLLSQFLTALGERPGYLIGGVLPGQRQADLGESKYFVIESDEYDSAYFAKRSKFQFYNIKHLVLTSLEFDHGDIFHSIEDILDEFRELIPTVTGEIICSSEYDGIQKLITEFSLQQRATQYGMGQNINILEMDSTGTKFELKDLENEGPIETNLIGPHNILNISACLLFLQKIGFHHQQMKEILSNLKLAKRRQEIKGYFKNAIVIDDFAHHPRAVKYTIEGVKAQFPKKSLMVVFSPESATARSSLFESDFTDALMGADRVILITPARSTSIKGASDINCYEMAKVLGERGPNSQVVTQLDELLEKINRASGRGGVILVLSNGPCLGLWESSWARELENR